MASLREYFATDFPQLMNLAFEMQASGDGLKSLPVPAKVFFDFGAAVRFVAVYLESRIANLEGCINTLRSVGLILESADRSAAIQCRQEFESPVDASSLISSGRVYLYVDAAISLNEIRAIEASGAQLNLRPLVRDVRWAAERSRVQKPLAFISHDSRDKDEIARPLALELSRKMCPVWFDEYSLKVGDSLRESIESGLREARKCVVILTPNFLSNPGWTKTEFNSIFTKELVENRSAILPVWAGVDRNQVAAYSLVLADRVGARWSDGIDKVVADLLRAIDIYAPTDGRQ